MDRRAFLKTCVVGAVGMAMPVTGMGLVRPEVYGAAPAMSEMEFIEILTKRFSDAIWNGYISVHSSLDNGATWEG